MIEFRLDRTSGVTTYRQLVQQVEDALRLGVLEAGDQLPTARAVVAALAINPNTVHKAYRELERDGLVESRPGQGTFVTRTLASPALDAHPDLRRSLVGWLTDARAAGLDRDAVNALFSSAMREVFAERVA
ncbi:GntR family transcriptional regulator [Cryptosporangium phraense]|uniref:GntR family transcriptional regulator n=1 Tax=Cryptosporangium phraense TaxID=2593070 RepID=A0A545AET3_9ACTN|nr:GntR family transcriptional regulator [Cryptosporangium phraense]TQS39770.1 GntR family transcriptional regulator [Cryptosporangium phraense]